jgi:hypothetical protein
MARLLAVAVVSVFVGAVAAQEFISTKPLAITKTVAVERPHSEVVLEGAVLQELVLEQPYAVPRVMHRIYRGEVEMPAAPALHPDLPADAKEIIGSFDTDAAAIRKKIEEAIQERRLRLIDELQKAQDRYTREAKLDEAVAIRDTIRKLKTAHLPVRPYPGSLYEFRQFEGQTLYFEVTGRIGGSVWGSDVYTGDSDLATAAVHAGAVAIGQTAVLEVQIQPSQPQYVSTTRNGVTSSGWGSYPFSYTVKRWVPVEKRPTP